MPLHADLELRRWLLPCGLELVPEQLRDFVAQFSKLGRHCDRFGKPVYDVVLRQVLSIKVPSEFRDESSDSTESV